MTLSSDLVYPIIFNVLIRISFTVTNALMITVTFQRSTYHFKHLHYYKQRFYNEKIPQENFEEYRDTNLFVRIPSVKLASQNKPAAIERKRNFRKSIRKNEGV